MTELWFYPAALALAFGLDLLLGDPPLWPHPVRLIGRVIIFLDRILRASLKGATAEMCGGVLLVLIVAGGSYGTVRLILAAARPVHFCLEFALTAYFLYAALAVRDLSRHVERVRDALKRGDLPLARRHTACLVSRDCGAMNETQVLQATLESLFENTADGVAAPLFYAALGGPALVFLYKAVSTMDSMVGYKNERYLHFGRAAARSDDLLAFIPARLSAACFLLAGLLRGAPWRHGRRVLMADRRKHESPNSAWPEAAAAAVLDLRLGGPASYNGKIVERPYLNEAGRMPGLSDLDRGLSLFYGTAAVAWAGSLVAAAVMVLLKEMLR